MVAHRLLTEYKVECSFENVQVSTARWLEFPDDQMERDFRKKNEVNIALDGAGSLTYVAPNMVNLSLTQERWPDVVFRTTREI